MAVSGAGGSNSGSNNNNTSNPYVCLSAHCDLLHYVGPVPHPYGGPTPQTIADRASRYVRFSCESLEKTPTVGVRCEHSLFTSVPLEKNAEGVPLFPFSGVGLALSGFRQNFDASSSESKSEFKLQQQLESKINGSFFHSHGSRHESEKNSNHSPNEATSPLPASSEVEPAGLVSGIYGAMNPFALRRVILQTLCVLNLPKRSPAVAFMFCAHDTTPFGVTSFFILPRCAEQIPALALPVKVSLLITRASNGDVLECNFSSSDVPNMGEGKNDGGMFSMLSTPSPLRLQWELNEDITERSQSGARTVGLCSFLSETVIIKLFFSPAARFSEGTENKDECVRRAVSWTQRRSFHLMALLAHCIWCEKVAWYVLRGTDSAAGAEAPSSGFKYCRAHLNWRTDTSFSNPTDKWETTLFFYSDMSGYDCCRESQMQLNSIAPNSSLVLQLTVRGCDEELCWGWSRPVPRVVRGGLRTLYEEHEDTVPR